MKQQQKPALANTAVNDGLLLNSDDIKSIAKFLDALMEADFESNNDEKVVINAC